jgi:hypothetical protein
MGCAAKDNQVSFLGLFDCSNFRPAPPFSPRSRPLAFIYPSGASGFLCYGLVTLLDTSDEVRAGEECNRLPQSPAKRRKPVAARYGLKTSRQSSK